MGVFKVVESDQTFSKGGLGLQNPIRHFPRGACWVAKADQTISRRAFVVGNIGSYILKVVL